MPNVSVFDAAGKKVEDLALSEAIFGITPNVPAMHLMVVSYLANQRQGTQSTLTCKAGLDPRSPVDARRYFTWPEAA